MARDRQPVLSKICRGFASGRSHDPRQLEIRVVPATGRSLFGADGIRQAAIVGDWRSELSYYG